MKTMLLIFEDAGCRVELIVDTTHSLVVERSKSILCIRLSSAANCLNMP